MHFIHARDKPRGKKTTYLNIVANILPQKEDPYRIRFTVGGERLDYPGPTATKNSEIQTANLLFNSTISTKGGRFMCIELKDFWILAVPVAIGPGYSSLSLLTVKRMRYGSSFCRSIFATMFRYVVFLPRGLSRAWMKCIVFVPDFTAAEP